MRTKLISSERTTSQVLKTCMNGASRIRITNRPNSNSLKVISYLLLIDEGLIEAISRGPMVVHKTTSKGRNMIERFEQIHNELDGLYA